MRPERPPPSSDPQSREREQLATFLSLALLVLFGGAFVAFLAFISFGLFLWVVVISLGIAAFAGVHYLVWGRLQPPRQTDGPESLDSAPRTKETEIPQSNTDKLQSHEENPN